MSNEQVVYLKPSQIVADDNSRFGLKRSRKDSLKASIISQGGIHTPIEVEPTDTPDAYRLTSGFYRHAAASELVKDGLPDLLIPAFVRSLGDDTARLRRQLSENMDRENQSPMDQSVAINKLLDAGVSRQEVRQMFAKPGKKGVPEPASNSWVNIVRDFVKLPKAIQEKIHSGIVGVGAAYMLGKVSPDKRAAVLARAEADYNAQLATEEKDETKYLAGLKKAQDAEEKAKALETDIAKAQDEVILRQEQLREKEGAFTNVQKSPVGKDPKAASEALGAAKNDKTSAEKFLKDATENFNKLLKQKESLSEVAKAAKLKLDLARKPKKAGKAGKVKTSVSASDVAKAAKAEGEPVSTGAVKLNLADLKSAITEAATQKTYPKVAKIMSVVVDCMNGEDTTKEMIDRLAVCLGELKPNPTVGKKS